jgi:TATA-binding protein-associated factor Taf7
MQVFEKYKNDSFIADNPILIEKFKKRAEILLKEIELITERYV